jgi:creatinine amidohydrolase
MLLHEQTTEEAAEHLAEAEVALLPTGSTEQHGPALALGMDHLAAEAVARSVDRPEAVVLPTLPVGVSEHHRQFHGTLSLSEDTFQAAVRETLASLAEHGVRKAVVVNGHGGNVAALRRAAMGLRREETLFAAPYNWWDGAEAVIEELFETGVLHADAIETSVLWHLHEELVRPDALERAAAGASDDWGHSVEGATVGFDTADFSDNGVAGRPTGADPEKGERVFEATCDSLDALVDWLAGRPFEELLPDPHR